MPSLINFIKYNRNKKLTIKIYLYTAYYRFMTTHVASQKLEKRFGIRGEESSMEETMENKRIAYLTGYHVINISGKTPYESKCLVRALTARKLLSERGIETTLYLGVGKDDGKMIAHAWLRCGDLYVTGGDGEGYATVAKFRCPAKQKSKG